MADQLSFAGFDAPRPMTDRLFFALKPDAQTAERILETGQRLSSGHGLTGRLLDPDKLHVTLYFPGDFAGIPEALIQRAREGVKSLSEHPFEVVLDRVLSFSGRSSRRPCVMLCEQSDALMGFQQRLATVLTQAGVPQHGRERFTPHLTLLYDARSVDEQPIEPIRWTASEFVLVHSLIGEGRHTTFAQWPLATRRENAV